MAPYAIAVVPADWDTSHPLGFSEAAQNQWRDKIESGTRVLIFKAAPVNAIVAEGEVHDRQFLRLADCPTANVGEALKTSQGTDAAYVLPIRLLYTRDTSIQIPLRTVQEYVENLSGNYPEWLPIEQEAYHSLSNWP